MIYKITIQHSTNYKNNLNTVLVGAKETGKAVEVALKQAKKLDWKEAVVVCSIEVK